MNVTDALRAQLAARPEDTADRDTYADGFTSGLLRALTIAAETERAAPPPQHERITGYRSLADEEIQLVNRIKEEGKRIGEMIAGLHDLAAEGRLGPGAADPGKRAASRDEAYRWIAIAKTHLQQGIMAAVRAVTQPDSF